MQNGGARVVLEALIFDLEQRGSAIEHSTFTDEFNFRSYRLSGGPKEYERIRVDMGPGRPEKVVERVVW